MLFDWVRATLSLLTPFFVNKKFSINSFSKKIYQFNKKRYCNIIEDSFMLNIREEKVCVLVKIKKSELFGLQIHIRFLRLLRIRLNVTWNKP